MDAQTVNKGVNVRDLGFTILANPDRATVDIILIHGLQGHPRNTWLYSPPEEKPPWFSFSRKRKRESPATAPHETFWPLDILPRDFSSARIMTYGYDSHVTHWFKGAAMKLDIDQYGESLLNAMEARRRDYPHRPLIFIVHSLGGLILKDALRRARSSAEARFKHVYNSVKTLLFFGTPHRGGSYVELGLTARRIAVLAGFDANDRVLRNLSSDGTHTRVLREEFQLVLKDLSPRIFIFQEGLGLSGFGPLNGKVVDDSSSALDVGEQKDIIVANHMNMCRFNGNDDDGYVKVKGALELAISEIFSNTVPRQGLSDTDREKLSLLYPVDPSNFKDDIIREDNQLLEDTGTWIFKEPATAAGGDTNRKQPELAAEAFAKWVIHDLPRVLWIKGAPGKGKTMLAISIIDELQRRNLFNVAHFFCKNSENRRNTAVNIIESILRQIYSWQPELLSHFDAYAKDLRGMVDPNWKFSTLWRVLENTVRDSKFQTSYFVIDGLDECEDTSALKFLRRLRQMNLELEKEIDHRTKVQWLITSRDEVGINREFGAFKADRALVISLEDNSEVVQKSVEQYIADRVRKLAVREGYDSDLQAAVEDYLRKHAHGTFLWVAIVCEELGGQPADVVEQTLQRLPSGLTSLYKRMLSQVLTNEDRSQARFAARILQATLVAFRPLTLRELAVTADLPKEIRKKDNSIRFYIRLCRSFLTIQSDRVSISHQSVKDYLLPMRCGVTKCPQEYDFKVLYHPNPALCECDHRLLKPDDYPSADRAPVVFPIDEVEVHRAIVSRSVESMTKTLRKNIYDIQEPSCSIEEAKVPGSDPLAPIRYACAYWIDHLCAIEGSNNGVGFSDIDKIIRFFKKQFLYWLEVMSLTENIPNAVAMLIELESVLAINKQHDEQHNLLSSLVYDARRFTLSFRSIIETHPLQIYNSALLFSPSKSLIRKEFSKEIPAWVQNERLPVLEENWTPYLHTLECHAGVVDLVAFSPDGGLLASGSDDDTVRLWNPVTGAALHTLKGHSGWVCGLEFSPNGTQLASCAMSYGSSQNNPVRVWDPTSGATIHLLGYDTHGFHALAFSADSNQLASLSRCLKVYVWNTVAGTVRYILECDKVVTRLAFSPDGSRLVNWNYIESQPPPSSLFYLWDLNTGMQVYLTNGHVGAVGGVAFSPNGKQLASGSRDGTIQLREPTGGRLLYTLLTGSRAVGALAFSPDSKRLAALSSSDRTGTLQLWNPATGDELHLRKGDFLVGFLSSETLKFSLDGSKLAFTSLHVIYLYDPVAGTMLHTLEGHGAAIRALAFSPNGSQLASASEDGTVRLWDPAAEALPLNKKANLEVHKIIFSPDGTRLASVSRYGTIRLLDPTTGAEVCSIAIESGPYPPQIAFSPDSKQLALGSSNGSIHIWDPVTGTLLETLSHPDAAPAGRYLTLSPDLRRLAGTSYNSRFKEIPLLDYTSGARLYILKGHTARVNYLHFSPDSSLLASGSDDNTIRLWDTATGVMLHILKSHMSPVWNFAVSPNNRRLAWINAHSDNLLISIWDIAAEKLLYTLPHNASTVLFTADGNHLLSRTDYGNWHERKPLLRDLATGAILDTLDCYEGLEIEAASCNGQDESRAFYLLDVSGCWITRNHQKVILLPPSYRAHFHDPCAIGNKRLAIGHTSGEVTILEFVDGCNGGRRTGP